MSDIKIKALDHNWVEGIIGSHRFKAKIYTEPSQFGINAGRVSKLWVRGNEPDTFINYDRGWDTGEDVTEIWKPLVDELEKFAQTDEFKKSLEAKARVMIKGVEIPGNYDARLGRFIVEQIEACVRSLFEIPTNEPGASAKFQYEAIIARAIFSVLEKQRAVANGHGASGALLEVIRDVAATLPVASRLHPDDLFKLQTRVCEVIAQAEVVS